MCQRIADGRESRVHSVREGLYAEIFIVFVDNEARKEVSFPMHNAERSFAGVKLLSKLESLCESPEEEVGIDFGPLGCEMSKRDQRMGVVEAEAERGSLFSQQLYELTGLRLSADFEEFVAEDPGVPGENTALLFFPENNLVCVVR